MYVPDTSSGGYALRGAPNAAERLHPPSRGEPRHRACGRRCSRKSYAIHPASQGRFFSKEVAGQLGIYHDAVSEDARWLAEMVRRGHHVDYRK